MKKLTGIMDSAAAAIDRLSFREKIMVGGMVVAILIFILFIGFFQVMSTLSQMEEENNSNRQALQTLMKNKDAFLAQKTESGQSMEQVENNQLRLTPFVEEMAKRVGITVENYDERRTPIMLQGAGNNKGGRQGNNPENKPDMVEESLTVTFRKVTLTQLTGFLDLIDSSHDLAVIKKLSLRTQWSNKSLIDVTMTVSTYKKA